MKIRLVEAELFLANGQKDVQKEQGNSHFSQFGEST
jgi:hypothetical protein